MSYRTRAETHRSGRIMEQRKWMIIWTALIVCGVIVLIVLFALMIGQKWISEPTQVEPYETEDAQGTDPIDELTDLPVEDNAAELETVDASVKDVLDDEGIHNPSANHNDPNGAEEALPIQPGQDNEQSEENSVTLSFVGDVMLGSTVDRLLQQHGYDYPYVYVQEKLQAADITIANMESPITDRGEAEENKQYVYRTNPQALPSLVKSGIDLVNLANNHILDQGLEGLLDTFKHLDQAGMERVGAGHDADEAFQPVYIEKNGMKIGFLGFSRVVPQSERSWKAAKGHAGVADTYNYNAPIEAIEQAKAQADLVIVIAHWGVERQDTPEDYQVELAHRYIDAGADLIVGSHAHVLQGFEQYKGKWIAYGLGNFIFTTNDNPYSWETVILEATCNKSRNCELQLTPILTKHAQPKLMTEEMGIGLFERINRISPQSIVQQDGKVINIQSGEDR